MSGRLTITPHRPLSEIVYEKLRAAIGDGELRPGQRLIQAELAERMGVSRIPVREALHRLGKEGLVELTPHRGAVVRRPSQHELEEAWRAIRVIVRAAMEYTSERATDEDVTTLEHLHRRMVQAAAAGRPADVVELDRRFHQGLFQAGGLGKLFDCVEILAGAFPQGDETSVMTRGLSAMVEHEEILRALKARDQTSFVTTVERHALNNVQSVVNLADGRGQIIHVRPERGRVGGGQAVPASPPHQP